MSGAIGYVVVMTAHPGRRARLVAALADLADRIRSDEPGNVYFDFYPHPDDADEVWIVERYRDEAAVEQHKIAKHMTDLAPAVREHVADMKITRLPEGTPA